jgi:hypothetical protein
VIPNPTGKGGFGDHPEHQNAGGRPKNLESFKYWMDFFKGLSVKEFMEYEITHPDSERTVACSLSYARVAGARKDLAEFNTVANRTEGMPKQHIDMDTDLTIKGAKEVSKTLQQILNDGQEETSSSGNS